MSLKYIILSDSERKLTDGSVVILTRFPQTKWIVHNGWYSYMGQRYNGWYFCSIPSQTVIPVNRRDLKDICIVSEGSNPCQPFPPSCHCDDECVPPKPPRPCPPPQPPKPCPPKPPRPPVRPVKSPEKYLGGVNYHEGQLVYLNHGSIYQVTTNFKSSWKEESVEANLNADVQSGHLAEIPAGFSERVDALEIRKYLINFNTVFGTDTPTKSDADNYLQQLEPPVEPGLNVSFKNNDNTSPTFGHVFTYFPHPTMEGSLIFKDDTVDSVTDISNKVDKNVAGQGGRIVKNTTLSKTDTGIQLDKDMLSLEDGTVITDSTEHSLNSLNIASKTELDTKINQSIAAPNNKVIISTDLTLDGSDIKFTSTSADVTTGLQGSKTDTVSISSFGLVTPEDLAKKVDKTVAGVGERITKNVEVDSTGDGFKVQETKVSLEDGTTIEKQGNITLDDMGAVSSTSFQSALSWNDID